MREIAVRQPPPQRSPLPLIAAAATLFVLSLAGLLVTRAAAAGASPPAPARPAILAPASGPVDQDAPGLSNPPADGDRVDLELAEG